MKIRVTLPSFCLLLMVSNTTTQANKNPPPFRMDYIYINDSDAYFKLHRKPETWLTAVQTCILEGASLATPTNADEMREMVRFMLPNTKYWLGFHNMYKSTPEKFYPSLKDSKISSFTLFWKKGMPSIDYKLKQLCVTTDFQGLYTNENCGPEKLPFICKRPRVVESRPGENTGAGYTYSCTTKAYYKYYSKETSWIDAMLTCALDGGQLATLEQEEEVSSVRNMFRDSKSIWAGGHSLYRLNTFVLLNDENYDISNLTWEIGEPNNLQGGEFCMELLKNNKMNDLTCDHTRGFVCSMYDYNHALLTDPLCTDMKTSIHHVAEVTSGEF